MMSVYIEDLQDRIALNEEISGILNQVAETALMSEGFEQPSEVSILLVDNEQIREINREQRKIDRTTDVLSFPMLDMKDGVLHSTEGDFDLDGNLLLLGDIVISMEKAWEQADAYGHSFQRELAFLACHGMFHLLGYDHETPEEEKIMMDKQEAVLEKLGLGRNP